MSEEEVIKRLNKILEEWQEIINIEDETEREINMSMYFEEMPFKEIQTVLQLLEQKDKRIDELEKALVDEAIKSTEKINKLKDKLTGDKMEQFDDYIIYLIESYLEILGE